MYFKQLQPIIPTRFKSHHILKPIIALVGRPNTGKSSLFNRLIGFKHAITADEAGTTRDRVYMHTEIAERDVIMIDTGGLSFADQVLDDQIALQSNLAISEADLILFIVDSGDDLTASDHEVAKILRTSKKPVILVANKSDHKVSQDNLPELYQLGFKDPIAVSAIHNLGLHELESAIAKNLPPQKKTTKAKDHKIKIGFIGKPNVGKSSLINKLLGKEQVIVSDISGTTRDSTALDFQFNDEEFQLIDTAGIRRRGKQNGIEKFGVMRTLKTIEEVEIALLILDGSEGLAKQDLHVSEFIMDAKKGLIVVINKADLIKPEAKNRLLHMLHHRMAYCPWAPVVFVSALTGTNITKLLELSSQIAKERRKEISVQDLNYFLKRATLAHAPNAHSTKKPKFSFVTQAKADEPTFVFFGRNFDKMHFSYRRYLENKLREEFGFAGCGIKLVFKNKEPDKQ